jgi:hypothetical protein
VAVANKVQTLDGRWLSIDGRVLFKATVAASETYNTALEQHLRDRLGVRFADRSDTDPGKRPVREIVGVDPALSQRWSSRRALIKIRQGELASRFQRDHGRPPTPVEALQLAQQATLETRDAKHEPRSLAEQRATWYAQAAETLGGPDAVQAMISKAFNPISITSPHVDAEWVAVTAGRVLAAVEERRSTWQSWHVRAEAHRQVRAAQVAAPQCRPPAAAAAQLRDATGAPVETLAKLIWSIDHGDLPDWAHRIGRSTLVIIDEAGMADTRTLDTAVQFIVGRGGSIRLVGDDQQLAAIGAGGVLRDTQASHGAARLSELHRFTDPGEAAATLALRDGRPEALGFYLDRGRVHVGGPTTTLDGVFDAWQKDRSLGLDAIMLAPTREFVSRLNQRARNHRLAGVISGRHVELADGNAASVGDLIITRRNDRRLRVTATDWVKNGDRWTILNLTRAGGLTVRHDRSGRMVTLPNDYVSTATELGYATTVHTAQGVTADTMHGLVTGEEYRQQLYTMLTRGRAANHIYLSVVGAGDPHTVIQPDNVHLRTATEMLEQILARDASPESATTLQREQQDPAVRLGAATARYLDALHVAAEHLAGPQAVANLDRGADRLLNGLTEEPAWPTLRGHLLLLAAAGADPVAELFAATAPRDLASAHDQAAVLDWRIQATGLLDTGGPLPWLPGIPDRIAADPDWAPYLATRSQLVAELADQARLSTEGETPAWAAQPHSLVPAELIADVQVWRAATQVDPGDLRPTGPPQLGHAARIWQQQLNTRIAAAADTHTDRQWRQLLARTAPSAIADSFLPELTERLSNLARGGFDATLLVRSAAAAGPLPDDHPAAALWWRILDQLPPTPNQDPVTANTAPATRQRTTPSLDRQRPRARSAPPPTFGTSR